MDDNRIYIYDLETFRNMFSAVIVHASTGTRWIFEISPRVNQAADFYTFLRTLEYHGCHMVGFNNVSFDYPVLHEFLDLYESGRFAGPLQMYQKAQQIIEGDRFGSVIWKPRIPQIDLHKIHHFDNVAKATSLKTLEFNMRSSAVVDLPYSPHADLTNEQIPIVIAYNAHDVAETRRFYEFSKDKIEFRAKLESRFGKSLLNHNDTKIGKDYFIMELEKAMPGCCFDASRKPRQTYRRSIPLRNVIFPYIEFETQEFSRVLDYLKGVEITDTKSAPQLKDLNAVLRGFRFDFGTGGIHGSLSSTRVYSDDVYQIVDVDVASYYPNLAIKNRVFPEHLSANFCDIYETLYNERRTHPKKSAESEMLKLALNGVYGDSNNVYGPFLDPAYTMKITINGQLLICLLAEKFLKHPDIHMIQANTDGVTCLVKRDARPYFDAVCEWWQKHTALELEHVTYEAMFIRDVNSYIAVSTDEKTGKRKVKRIGAYAFETAAENPATRELGWHKDHSALVVPKAAQAAMLDGANLSDFVYGHTDAFDFMLRAKVNRGSRLVLQRPEGDEPLQSTTRYFIATDGAPLVKIMPPLAKNGPEATERRIGVNVGYKVRACNHVTDWNWSALDRSWYISEADKLVIR